jgi:hypothetical protein
MAVKKKKTPKTKSHSIQTIYAFLLDRCSYEQTKNPIFLWSIYRLCRNENIAIPEWIFKYLDDCADKITTNKDPGDKVDSLCSKALRLKTLGAHTHWKKANNQIKKWRAYNFFEDEKKTSPNSTLLTISENTIQKLVDEHVIESEISERTLRHWKKDIKGMFKDKKQVDSVFDEIRKLFK